MFLNIVVFTITCLIMASFIGLPLFLRSHIVLLQRVSVSWRSDEFVEVGNFVFCEFFANSPNFQFRNQHAKKRFMHLNWATKLLRGRHLQVSIPRSNLP
jgi:hypothetical protein